MLHQRPHFPDECLLILHEQTIHAVAAELFEQFRCHCVLCLFLTKLGRYVLSIFGPLPKHFCIRLGYKLVGH